MAYFRFFLPQILYFSAYRLPLQINPFLNALYPFIFTAPFFVFLLSNLSYNLHNHYSFFFLFLYLCICIATGLYNFAVQRDIYNAFRYILRTVDFSYNYAFFSSHKLISLSFALQIFHRRILNCLTRKHCKSTLANY